MRTYTHNSSKGGSATVTTQGPGGLEVTLWIDSDPTPGRNLTASNVLMPGTQYASRTTFAHLAYEGAGANVAPSALIQGF